MKSTIEKLPKSRIKLSITLTADEFKPHYEKALKHLQEHLRMPGFRPGKAPLAMVEKHFGTTAVEQEAVEKAIPLTYFDVIQEHKLHPLEQPHIDLEKVGESLEYTAEVDVMPEVELKDWQKIRVKPHKTEIVEAEAMEKIFNRLRQERADFKDIERAAKTGDYANISFVGRVGGVEREDMASKNHPLIIGEGSLIPGFEEQVVGMKQGEQKSFKIQFPKDYHNKELAKKEAEFDVTLEMVKEVVLPEVDDAFAKNFDKKNVEDLKKAIREQLEQEAEKDARQKTEELILSDLVKRTKTTLPESIIEGEIDRIIANMKEGMGLDDEQFAGYLTREKKSMEEFRKEARVQAEKNAMVGLALGKIMELEKIDANNKESIKKVLDMLYESATK